MLLNKRIEELCQAVSQEQNSNKLLSLVDELNKELDNSSGDPPQGRHDNNASSKPAGTKDPRAA